MGGAALFLLLVLFTSAHSAAQATAPAPPETVVLYIRSVEFPSEAPGTYVSYWNLTFRLSPDDPDQVDGSLDYSFWFNGIRMGDPIEVGAIPGRPGWVYHENLIAGSGDSNFTLQLTANATGSPESAFACRANWIQFDHVANALAGVSADFRLERTHVSCGRPLAPPAGVGAIVTRAPNETVSGLTEILWQLSPDDPERTNGSFDYRVHWGPNAASTFPYKDGTPQGDGTRKLTLEFFAASSTPVYAHVQATDPLTRQQSSMSCTVYVDAYQFYDRNNCGSETIGGPAPGDKAFPFVDITSVSENSGMSPGLVATILGVGTVVGLCAIAFTLGGAVAATVAGFAGLAFVAALGILPLYVLVVIFLCATAVVVMRFKGGGGE